MDRTSYQQSKNLTSRLRDAKADDKSKQSTSRFKKGRDNTIFDSSSEEDTHHTRQNQEPQIITPPKASSAWHTMGRSPETTPGNRLSVVGSVSGGTPRSLGARDVEDQVDKLLKQNFDLKLEVFHLREWKEKAGRKWGGAQRFVEENEELRRANQELASELKRRDQAVDEAVVMICDLEERLKTLEEELRRLNVTDDSEDEHSHRDPNTTTRGIPPSVNAIPRTRHCQSNHTPEGRLSFLEDPKTSTHTLRSIYFEGDKAVRPIPSHATLASHYSSDEESQAEEDDTPVSPAFSVISETELQSIYGDQNHNIHEKPDGISGLQHGSFPICNEMTSEGTYARVHRWVADGKVTRSDDAPFIETVDNNTPSSHIHENRSRITLTDNKQGSQRKGNDTKVSDQSITSVANTRSSSRYGTNLPASNSIPDIDQNTGRTAQVQAKESTTVNKKAKKKHHPKSTGNSTKNTRVSSQCSNTFPMDSTSSTPEMVASKSLQSLQGSLHDSQKSVGRPLLAKHDSDNSHSHNRYGENHKPSQYRPVSPSPETAVPQKHFPEAATVCDTPRKSRNSVDDINVPDSVHTEPAYISRAQIERIGPFVNLRDSSHTSITSAPVFYTNHARQSRSALPDETSPPTSHNSHEHSKLFHHQQSSFGGDTRIDPSLRRRASLRDRVKRSLGRRNSMTGNTNGSASRRNSITRLFSFGGTHDQEVNEGKYRGQGMERDYGLDVGNAAGTKDNQASFNTTNHMHLSRQSSSTNYNSTSSGRATSHSNHSNHSTGTSLESGRVFASSAPSSYKGVTVTTVRLPFATVNTKKRRSFSRKLSLSGPTIETRDNGSMIGFPRRGKDGRVASIVAVADRVVGGATKNEVS